jgi:predicted  nucleic acid-binding Zn-ribbon protein
MSDLLRRLIDYHHVARELASTRALLAGVPDDMRALHDEFTAARALLDALDAGALDARKRRIEAEGAISDAQERLKKFQQQVPKVRNQREYAALLTEIDTAKGEIRRLEEEALAAIEAADQAVTELEERKVAFADLEARYAAGLAEWEAKKPDVARRAAELEASAGDLQSGLAKGVVAQYERIADKYRGAALSALRKADGPAKANVWFCSTCNFEVRPQIAVEIRMRGTIVHCEGCLRFLLAPEDAG